MLSWGSHNPWGSHSFSFCSPLRVSGPAAFCELLSEATQHTQVRRCPIWSHQFGKRALGFPGGMEEAKVALDKCNSEGPQTSSIEKMPIPSPEQEGKKEVQEPDMAPG